MSVRITGLGDIRLFDKESGELILEGQLEGMTFKDEKGQGWRVKKIEPKKCPNCGTELK